MIYYYYLPDNDNDKLKLMIKCQTALIITTIFHVVVRYDEVVDNDVMS